jgi:hypothetical protein
VPPPPKLLSPNLLPSIKQTNISTFCRSRRGAADQDGRG